MKNYLSAIRGYRSDLRAVDEAFRPRFEAAERFRGSRNYDFELKCVTDARNAEVVALRAKYSKRFIVCALTAVG
jgi:hypothetical protein